MSILSYYDEGGTNNVIFHAYKNLTTGALDVEIFLGNENEGPSIILTSEKVQALRNYLNQFVKDATMAKDEAAIEQEIQAKNLNAPRLTPIDIDDQIKDEYYYVVPNTTLTFCALTLKNGFMVTGTSAAASPENFNEEIGRKIAYSNARDKIWALQGYLLKQSLYEMEIKNGG